MNQAANSPADDSAEDQERTARLYSGKADRLLSKYAAVWLWSILLGTTSGLLWSSYYFRVEQYGHNILLLLVPALASMACSFRALLALRSMLFDYILPEFFAADDDRTMRHLPPAIPGAQVAHGASTDALQGRGHPADSAHRQALPSRPGSFAKHTRIAVNCVILAVIFRIAADVLWIAFGPAAHSGF
jgi:hypothetical protein